MPTATLIGSFEPFDIRRCPIWAIPQLAFFKRKCKANDIDIEFFEFKHGGGVGLVTVGVAGSGIFTYGIIKSDMNSPEKPLLFPWAPPTRAMKVGDHVRSERYGIEGVIREIVPCTATNCDEMLLTLDPPGKTKDGMGVTRFYYHVSNVDFKFVASE